MRDEHAEAAAFRRAHEEAAQWAVKKSMGLSEEERQAYESWLAAHPCHTERLEANERVWKDADLLRDLIAGPEGEPDLSQLEPAEVQSKRFWRKTWSVALAAAACLALGLYLLSIPDGTEPPSDSYRQAFVAETFQRQFLPDGTLVEMKEGAEISVIYDQNARRVRLRKGEAHFSVTEDSLRPFEVEAGPARFRAVGTAFAVSLEDAQVKLLVTEGVVRLTPAEEDLAMPDASGVKPSFSKDLVAKERIAVSRDLVAAAPQIERITEAEIDQLLSWKHEILDFEATPLAVVVQQFNQRNRDQLVLADPSLGSIEIDGSFRSDNLSAFVRLLGITTNIKADLQEHGPIRLYRD